MQKPKGPNQLGILSLLASIFEENANFNRKLRISHGGAHIVPKKGNWKKGMRNKARLEGRRCKI